jgi:hypothetical protein
MLLRAVAMEPAILAVMLLCVIAQLCAAENVPLAPFHLTARPWTPMKISRDAYLDSIEGICRFTAKHLGPDGEVIDPLLKREHQYSTPYFAFAVGTLVQAGRAKDLLPAGVAAMDHATACFAKGAQGIPDNHGEFFVPCLAGALDVYEKIVPPEKLEQWRSRMKLLIEQIGNGKTSNWRAYAMRGQWLRHKHGLVDRNTAIDYIEDSWRNAEQRERIGGDMWNLYQDHQTDPEPHAVEAVGRGNLLGLVENGYDGPSAGEMREMVERGTRVSMLLQDPTGQCPPDGRADCHVWNDVVYGLCFDVMAERAHRAGDKRLAGQYHRAAMLAFASKERWRHGDDDRDWAGSYYITKNRFDPRDRVGYQRASNIGNYNGAIMLHLAEAYLARQTDIAEEPAPTEIGGYAFATDQKFASAVANAGGMQMFAALRGDTKLVYDHYWTSLGVNRFSRAGWESRLGPSDGVRDAKTGRGVTFAPTWKEDGKWVRLADLPERYAGKFSVQFAHPLLVRCAIDYAPVASASGPRFRHSFVITPDGVLARLTAEGTDDFAVTWPVMENDGRPLEVAVADRMATTRYNPVGDQQCFIAIGGLDINNRDDAVQSTYGWLRPMRSIARWTFIYPRSWGDPPAELVRDTFRGNEEEFKSLLATVTAKMYIGRASAGGEGQSIDIDADGTPDASFTKTCQFVLQLRDKKVTAVEVDRDVVATIAGEQIGLSAYKPVMLSNDKNR